jgi:hypothetical protein
MIISIIDSVNKFFEEVLQEKCRILTVIKDEDKWKVVCEVSVDPEYTTRKGLGDLVEVYNVYLNDNEGILGYEIIATKKRAALSE